MGNSWFNPGEEWYGFVSVSYGRYINKSFDLNLNASTGDFGHCRDSDDPAVRSDGSRVLNMLSRLTTGIVTVKYKFANGYLLKENAKIAPYVFLGAGMNNVTDFWWTNKSRVNKGNYGSINAGLGVRYNFTEKYNLTYNLGFGYFTSDNIDYRVQGINDMYMQHTFSLGINF